ncbi:LysM peptidoglycan-binding domain-containing protein [Phytoactinopolyspora mesophila]|nr:LysM peptidoglycan-binding domain-containing protein [Phytoactinopolyspora mesophila]
MAIITAATVRKTEAQAAGESRGATREHGRRVVMLGRASGRVAGPGAAPVEEAASEAPVRVRRVRPAPIGDRQLGDRQPVGVRRVSPGRAAVRSCSSAAAPSMHGSRLTRRGRIVVALIWVVLIAAAALPFAQQGNGAGSDAQTVSVPVEAGDTLWHVARAVNPDADPRPLVDAIIELNGLRSGSDIHPGDTLLVPLGLG